MPENFLISISNASAKQIAVSNASAGQAPEAPANKSSVEGRSDRESLRLLVIGSRQGVIGTIQTLHRLRFAEVHEWSPLLPGANPGEVMSILTRYNVMT